MQVRIDGRSICLKNDTIVGVGGEATVFAHGSEAIKLYQAPTAQRARKLQALLPVTAGLPVDVIAPQRLVLDQASRQVIGFTMRLLSGDYTEVRSLANRQWRAQAGIDTRQVVQGFLRAHTTLQQIHQRGLVVGDLNDLNLIVRADEVLFIDVDSFQFGQFPCPVGTEAFLDPALYGIDLARGPVFTPDNDWYAFAVLLFRSLLLVHPYGGVHPRVKLLTQRAEQRLSVFDSAVKYPRIAYRPELLSDDLAQVFAEWFEAGRRGEFPAQVLRDYLAALKTCPACGAAYPLNRAHCPVCAKSVPVVLPSVALAGGQTLLQTNGPIVAWHVDGSTISLIAHEDDQAVFYRHARGQVRRVELFRALPHARYAFSGDRLIVAPAPDDTCLHIVDVAGTGPHGLLQTETTLYGRDQPIFGANRHAVYRLAGGYLMRGRWQYDQFIETPVLAVANGQTWFQVAPSDDRVFGLSRLLNTAADDSLKVMYHWWLLHDSAHHEVTLSPLDDGETLLEVRAVFAAGGVLVLRRTRHDGREQVRLDEIDNTGRSLCVGADVDGLVGQSLAASTYAQHVLVYPTDNGVAQQRLDNGASRLFAQTEPFVRQGDLLQPYEAGLLVRQVNHLRCLTL